MLGAYIARGLKYIHVFHAHKHARLPLHLTGEIHQHVESQMNINPPPTHTPSEVLLLCLQVVLPGILPAASRFHVAGGIILPFVCACASAGVCVRFAPECDAFRGYYLSYLFSVLAAGQPATCEIV